MNEFVPWQKRPENRQRAREIVKDWRDRHKEERKQYRAVNKQRDADKALERIYGSGVVEWRAEQMVKQNGVCAMGDCGKPAEVVDHDHSTGRWRGLLCQHCNKVLSFYENRRRVFEQYLEAF